MDVGFFLRERIAFIRQFYDAASRPFLERKRKIEAEEEPFVPPYSEDNEPPFLTEWMEADESLHVLGYSCISMLEAALHIYLKTWEHELRIPVGGSIKSEFNKKGWFNGYKTYFGTHLGIDFVNCPANLSILEEIVLARNRVQHPDSIVSRKINYSPSDLKRIPHFFFADERERIQLSDIDETERPWLFPPDVYITEEKLMTAIGEVEKFSNWLEAEIVTHVYNRKST